MSDKKYPDEAPPAYYDASRQNDPSSYHNWQEVVPEAPDFPPPAFPIHDFSSTGNATGEDAERASEFCERYPLLRPTNPSRAAYEAVQNHNLRPVPPREFKGKVFVEEKTGHWKGDTDSRNGECVVLSHLPLYFATSEAYETQTIYFEVKLTATKGSPTGEPAAISVGYVAQPYPSWRFPGWDRGSLGVCSDDGHRFVNDDSGGKDFTRPVEVGETIGIGMQIGGCKGGDNHRQIKVFFKRNGEQKENEEWDLHEVRDSDSGGIEGLEGDYDLYAAIGIFGGVEFEACFDLSGCLWKSSSINLPGSSVKGKMRTLFHR